MGLLHRKAIGKAALRTLVIIGALAVWYVLVVPLQIGHAQGIGVQPEARGAWRTYLYDNARTGLNPTERAINPATVSNLKLQWSLALPSSPSISSQPIVAGNRVYWGAWDGYERATDLNGAQVWRTFLGQTIDSVPGCWPPMGGPASAGTLANIRVGSASSVLFVSGGDSKFYALDARNGNILWATSLGTPPDDFIWGAPALYKGSIYIGIASFMDCPDVQGKFFKLSATTGKIQATFDVVPHGCLGGGIWSSPAIDVAAGTIYVSTGNPDTCNVAEPNAPGLLELRASDLKLISAWTVPPDQYTADGDFGSTPTLFRANIAGKPVNLVGLINKNGNYYTFRREALQAGPVWMTQLARNCPTCANDNISSSAWDGQTLYVGTNDAIVNGTYCPGTLAEVDPGTGRVKSQVCLPDGPVMSAVTVVPGLVAVAEGNRIMVIASGTGKTLFSYASSSQFEGAITISNGRLFAGNMGGNFYVFGR